MLTLRRAIGLLTPQERRKGLLVMLLMIVTAILEMLGVASVFPFLGVLADPGAIARNAYLARAHAALGSPSTTAFLFLLGGAAFAMILLAALARTLNLHAINRFTFMRRHTISTRLLAVYLRQPYAFFLDRHSGDLAKGILAEVNQVMSGVFQPAANMIAQGFTLIALAGLLLLVDPWVAGFVALTLGTVYAAIYLALRPLVERIGRARAEAIQTQFEVAGEVLGGIKDIKILGRERSYLDRYSEASRAAGRSLSAAATLSQVPKFGIEAVAFGGIILLALTVLAREGGHPGGAVGQVVPVLGLYTLAGYKLLPAIQTIYRGMLQLRFGAAAVDALHDDMARAAALPRLARAPAAPLPLTRALTLDGVGYSYPGADRPGVSDITLRIPAGQSLGIVGSTGAGKTTLVDLILGLLEPTEGRRLADEVEITPQTLRVWQANVGYVPQSIFLVSGTIAENIALGVPAGEIDRARVETCARMARVHEFITEGLGHGYDTQVGERGVRLSGGQRQRIGIARALYRDPALLVLDEATSALDTATEQEVMAAIGALAGTKTVIMIAHRLSTVARCDRIVVLDKGRIAGTGDHDELMAGNAVFRAISGR
ncbi:MAG: ABC transporter ATP-binding protein [Sedimentitalea sp.]|nr:ABC transporter ATP-binding protein [Sedimentitalea sp.]